MFIMVLRQRNSQTGVQKEETVSQIVTQTKQKVPQSDEKIHPLLKGYSTSEEFNKKVNRFMNTIDTEKTLANITANHIKKNKIKLYADFLALPFPIKKYDNINDKTILWLAYMDCKEQKDAVKRSNAGRKRKYSEEQIEEALKYYYDKKVSLKEVGKIFNMHPNSLHRFKKNKENNKPYF